METNAETPRPELIFDGFGINGPDKHRTRIATLIAPTLPSSHTYGHLFAASPELVKALAGVDQWLTACLECKDYFWSEHQHEAATAERDNARFWLNKFRAK